MDDFVNLWRIRHSILQKDVQNKLSDLCNLLTTNALFKEIVDSTQKRTVKTEIVSMIYL